MLMKRFATLIAKMKTSHPGWRTLSDAKQKFMQSLFERAVSVIKDKAIPNIQRELASGVSMGGSTASVGGVEHNVHLPNVIQIILTTDFQIIESNGANPSFWFGRLRIREIPKSVVHVPLENRWKRARPECSDERIRD